VEPYFFYCLRSHVVLRDNFTLLRYNLEMLTYTKSFFLKIEAEVVMFYLHLYFNINICFTASRILMLLGLEGHHALCNILSHYHTL